jgi:hypothetical protein
MLTANLMSKLSNEWPIGENNIVYSRLFVNLDHHYQIFEKGKICTTEVQALWLVLFGL